jgi:hypothetical protein
MNGPKWKSQEIFLLIKYHKATNKKLREVLPGRNLSAVLQKMHRMGLVRPIDPEDRFRKFIEIDIETGCWIWIGSRQGTKPWDYGSFWDGDKIEKAHHYSYEIHKGPIPTGILVLHKCDNPPCVNPDHLFLGTTQDNVDDMFAKGRNHALKGSENGNALLTEETVLKIRSDIRPVKEIAKDYGVSPACIYDARSRRWKHI